MGDVIMCYKIKKVGVDFKFLESNYNIKGTRRKKIIIDNENCNAIFKYEAYNCSEACSEKICYEIAKILNYPCAKIELAKDYNGTLGVLNYSFIKSNDIEHIDAVSYLNVYNMKRNEYYTISNIKNRLDELDEKLFKDFIKIMIFDALVGEQDRHEENWGLTKCNGKYSISPLYDNGCSLLREFKDLEYASKFYKGVRDFNAFIYKSKTYIYKENSNKRYKHFELIKYLNNNYSEFVQSEINKLYLLEDFIIERIVNKIPNELLTSKHKEFIINYLKKRRDILLGIK